MPPRTPYTDARLALDHAWFVYRTALKKHGFGPEHAQSLIFLGVNNPIRRELSPLRGKWRAASLRLAALETEIIGGAK